MRFAFLVVGFFLSVLSSAAAFDGTAKGEVIRVIDGDTVKVRVGIWIEQELTVSVRLDGVDTPELFRPKCPAEKELARKAKVFVEEFLSGGEVNLTGIKRGKYAGRVVARVDVDGRDLGAALVAAGLAFDGAKGAWCS